MVDARQYLSAGQLFATLVRRRARRDDGPLANAFTPSCAWLDLAIGRMR